VAGLIERAVAREVAAKLPLDILDGDRQPTRDQIFSVSTNRLSPTERHGMGVAPAARLIGRLAGRRDLAAGQRMRVWFETVDGGVVVPQWKPA